MRRIFLAIESILFASDTMICPATAMVFAAGMIISIG
jgi:hypothetical protein